MKRFLFFCILFVIGNGVLAFDIVYPKSNNVSVTSPSIFFIGSSKNSITVNGEPIKLHLSGGFAHFVNLNDGVNKFEFKSKKQSEVFEVTKITRGYEPEQPLILYKTPKYLKISDNYTPMRATPEDYGMNRLSHLQSGILFTSDGEQNGFYRIVLGKDSFAWVDKKRVSITESYDYAVLENVSSFQDGEYIFFVFKLDKRIPYAIREQNGIALQFYNIKDNKIYDFQFPINGKILGYNGEYFENSFILKIRKQISVNPKHPLKGITIAIDAGHGGAEFGAVGCLGDKEKDVVLKFAKYLQKELQRQGANVIMTRDDDEEIGLRERTEIANKNNSLIFISLHNNALPDNLNPNESRGTSVYYYYDEAKPLAENILKSTTKELGTSNDGLYQKSFAVVRNPQALSVIIEIGYLINPYDNVLLINKTFQKRTAKAIRKGIENYLLSD